MASFNLTVEDSSPLISYSPAGAWSDSPANDTLLSSYSGSSYHITSTQGATATITFTGIGITIFGGHRQNYGTYQISVDGQTVVASESSAGQDVFQQVLGTVSGLSNEKHTAVVTSSSASSIDIDYVNVQTQIGETGSQLTKSTVDDSDPSFIYTPASEWSVNDQNYFMNDTLHYTSSAGASASVTFSGEAVALYGTVSQDHADIQLSLDGQNVTFGAGANGFASTLHSQILLYYAQGLGSNQHSLVVAADPQSGTGPFIDVDAVVVYSSIPGSTTSSSKPTSTSSQRDMTSSGKLPTKTIVGIIVGSIFGFLLLLALLLLLLRWRRWRRQGQADLSPLTPTLPIQNPDMLEAGLSTRSGGSRLSQNSMSSFYSGTPPEEGFMQGHSRDASTAESFSSTAPINASSAVPATRDHSISSNVPIRPNLRPPPLKLPVS
ncbi:uncharacterized protein C8R40DRAFT_1106945 [Lentinula edodes]|uniref:uncharacterized protein n=1 Tax=Lentinula edodes TaxID=5353 RepID=UPI001E8E7152|nr:uncharacterized protein C8R40DRAFT_1106945 [Lentinula edodes]KAH7874559.1 hypothetical protein C8R40DRAFT_1106945 [Lentinula edodes]